MIDGSVLQSAQQCFEKKSRVVVKMVVTELIIIQKSFKTMDIYFILLLNRQTVS